MRSSQSDGNGSEAPSGGRCAITILRRAGVTRVAAIALASGLVGCGGAENSAQPNASAPSNEVAEATAPAAAPEPAAAPAAERPDAAPAAAHVLTANGYGPLRIGMSRAEVVAAMGEDRNPNAVGGPEPESCDQFFPARAPEGLLVMIQDGRLSRIDLIDSARTATDKGLRVGAPAAAVRTPYGSALIAEPHKYVEAPAQYLTAWTTAAPAPGATAGPNVRGIRYEVGHDGTVEAILAGGPSIQYVEGCA